MKHATEHTAWYAQWCEPIVVALYERDRQQIIEALRAAKKQIESGSLDPETRACLQYQVAYLEYQAIQVVRDPQLIDFNLNAMLDLLGNPGESTAAEGLRKRLYLQVRIFLDRAETIEFFPEEFEGIFKNLPENEFTTEVWHYIASWAFKHSKAEYLARAYEFAVSNARGFNVAWAWQRVHFMWQLVMGKATQHDLIWLIKRASITQQLQAIKKCFWDQARERGLINDRVEVILKEREIELSKQHDQRVHELLRPHMGSDVRPHAASRS
jgi:hypothetical protein